MAELEIMDEQTQENALLNLVNTKRFVELFECYLPNIFLALCINNKSQSEKYFKDLFPRVYSCFLTDGQQTTEDKKDLSDYLQTISNTIGHEKMKALRNNLPALDS
jgi:hypothetical protein